MNHHHREQVAFVEDVLSRLENHQIVTRRHIRTIGNIAKEQGIEPSPTDSYQMFLEKVLKKIERSDYESWDT